jgi:signal transduction histidine kinase
VAIAVVDSGAGMSADRLATIFERFARLDEARTRDRGGVGLGLAIVKAIARAHGGTVQARSAPGAGSVFELTLPLKPTPNGVAGARLNVLAGPRLQGEGLRG